MLVIACPGQGSQSPGFLSPWMDLPSFRDRLEWFSVVAGIDLVAHGTTSDAATIRDTAIAQPLIVGAGLTTLLALFPHPAEGFARVGAGVGHSVGEVTAAAATGVISAEAAMVFVRERGSAMAAAGAVTATGMSAVLGGDPDEVAATVERHGLAIANHNGIGQVVAAGTLDQLAALRADPPAKARVMPLQVAGAFHTEHMTPAEARLGGFARAITRRDAHTPLIGNADGAVVSVGREVLERLVSQVSRPVRWDLCMRTLVELGVTGFIEMPPSGTLAGLAKRGMPGVEILSLKTPDDLDAAKRMVLEHGTPPTTPSPDPTWRLVVAPGSGTITRSAVRPGDDIATGVILAHVQMATGVHDVTAAHAGRVLEWLVADGDPVAPGQPILRLDDLFDAVRGAPEKHPSGQE